ncbi:helix-turn-helix domain-containing protein [Rhodococcus sp. IEGM 1401]|uniref:helix-turn-helix domain-containing protein n=1 Tax=Rhodococcus sp. IEGM 1372 TaxID=3047087 RepID=UPI0022B42B47|nr:MULTISPECIES: AraC family transcriptional regulator [unclassified Rhodococcus (in: high G+C Gram-positive bacteria)]MCZ4563757.1 helix-turn-helix domain-containing protein [Rhodococcus sp. IEGM 1401]MDI9923854.1 helix-turn-helix domain-containing protein [Rhodococcus sp. IEGM 1372]MDV8036347.1 helix-turn-helix domain-containing protein [Rhodococcus sp. IEGM 1414]
MGSTESGVPPLAFAQLLGSGALGERAEAAFRRILVRDGVSMTELVTRDGQVPLRWFREVYPDLDRQQGFRLGATFAQYVQPTSFGPLSLPLISAGSVAEMVELLEFLPLVSTALAVHIHHTDRGLTIGLAGRTGDEGLDSIAVAYGGSCLLRLIDMLAGFADAVELHLDIPAPERDTLDDDEIRRIVFDAPSPFVFVPAAILDEACRFSDSLSYQLGIAELKKAVDGRRTKSYTDTVRALFDTDRECTNSAHCARRMAVSTSTLKRKLGNEGATFRALRQAFLQERATVRLLDGSVTVGEIAAELGYSDVASFSHAFTRWTGRSPREFRSRTAAPR